MKRTIRGKFYVYVVFRPNGKPCYVGKGTKRRFQITTQRNKHLTAIQNKSDKPLPLVIVRKYLTEKEALQIEIALIKTIGRKIHGGVLVNQTDGGEGITGHRHSKEVRKAMRIRMKKRMADPEARTKISKSLKKALSTPEAREIKIQAALKCLTPELRKRRSEVMRKRVKNNPNLQSPMLGKKHSEETKRKIRESNKITAIKRFGF